MAGRADEERLTLHDVAAAGVAKAVAKRRGRPGQQDHAIAARAGAFGVLPQARERAAPECGGFAAHRDDEESRSSPRSAGEGQQQGRKDATAYDAGDDWLAEETQAGDSNDAFDDMGLDWEDEAAAPFGEGETVHVELGAGDVAASTDASAEAKKRALAAKRSQAQFRRLAHRASALVLVSRGLLLDAAADSGAVQAAALQVLPQSLQLALRSVHPSDSTLGKACAAFAAAFTVVRDGAGEGAIAEASAPGEELWEAVSDVRLPDGGVPTLARAVAVRLLQCARARRGAELHVAALFVAALRACGHLTRFVCNLQVVPLTRAIKPDETSAPKIVRPGAKRAADGVWTGTARVATAQGAAKPKKRKSAAAQPAPVGDAAGSGGERPAAKALEPSAAKPAAASGGETAGGTGSGSAEAGPSGAAGSTITAADKAEKRSRGDAELEAQLQMAMMASAAEAERSAEQRSTAGAGAAAASTSGRASAGAAAREMWERRWGGGGGGDAAERVGWAAWAEVFCGDAASGGWVHADPLARAVRQPERVETEGRAGAVVAYIVAFQGGAAKDVTQRYAASLMRSLKERDEKWWTSTLEPFKRRQVKALATKMHARAAPATPAPATASAAAPADPQRLAELMDTREAAELEQRSLRERQELPKTVEGFKRSTVYILQRHITKYQGLAPGTKRLGLHRGESYYDRSRVSELHSAARWRREGREVVAGELAAPTKTIAQRAPGRGVGKARPPPPPAGGDEEADAPTTDLFGAWQTRELVLPVAENGIVPKNDRGNVEAPPFAKALPGGTTHVDVPRAFAACRRLGVDHAPALVGFEASRGGMLPKISGVVVCSEHADAVRASALEDEAARQAKAREKREQVAVEAWRQVVNAVHQRLRLQASVDEETRLNSVTADARRKQARRREGQAGAAAPATPARKRAAKSAGGENGRGPAGKARKITAGAKSKGCAAGKRVAKQQQQQQQQQNGAVAGEEDTTIGATLRRLVAAQADPQDVEML